VDHSLAGSSTGFPDRARWYLTAMNCYVVAKPSEEAESGWARSFTVIRAGRGQARRKPAEEENHQGSQTGTRTLKAPSSAAMVPETPPYPQSGDQE